MSPPIRNVSDTALWVAMYRAAENDRPDAIFRDPFARRLAGPRGAEIVASMHRSLTMDWPIVVRTAVMDELVLRCVAQGCKCVLNLAAGLDARPWRLPLPKKLHWIDADMPAMVAYKAEQLAGETPRCHYESVAVDLADAKARDAVLASASSYGPVLVIAEGLLVYLEPAVVAELAAQLHQHQAMRWWLFDLASPPLLQMLSRRIGKHLQAGNTPFRFGPAEGTAFFQPHGWREVEFRSTWGEAMRLNRTPRLAWLWNLLGKLGSRQRREQFRRFSGIVLMERE